MTWPTGFALAALLAAPLPTISAASAEPVAFGRTTPVAMTDEKGGSGMSEADKRAKAIDCSKQADEKKLHGMARKKFRESCKSGK